MTAMPNVLVRDLPDDVHSRLVDRARAGGRSLQQYLVVELTRIARTVSLEEFITRIESNRGVTVGLARAVDDLDGVRHPE